MVLRDCKIAEQGTYDDLLSRRGNFRRLHDIQRWASGRNCVIETMRFWQRLPLTLLGIRRDEGGRCRGDCDVPGRRSRLGLRPIRPWSGAAGLRGLLPRGHWPSRLRRPTTRVQRGSDLRYWVPPAIAGQPLAIARRSVARAYGGWADLRDGAGRSSPSSWPGPTSSSTSRACAYSGTSTCAAVRKVLIDTDPGLEPLRQLPPVGRQPWMAGNLRLPGPRPLLHVCRADGEGELRAADAGAFLAADPATRRPGLLAASAGRRAVDDGPYMGQLPGTDRA